VDLHLPAARTAYDVAIERLLRGLSHEPAKVRDELPAHKSLLEFTKATFPAFEENWHHALVCDYLTRFARGEISRLMIFLPPRHSKSELVSRRLPAFLLGRNPDTRIIACSYTADLATMMSRDVQRIMTTPAYQRLFPGTIIGGPRTIQTTELFEIRGRAGYYRAAGIGGGITGMGASYAIIDDPIKSAEEAHSKAYRDKIYDWYVSTLYTRLEQPGSILLTMTRWHTDDLAGRLLEISETDPTADKWLVVRLPARASSRNTLVPEDTRHEGEALWPSRYDTQRLRVIEKTLGSYWWQAIYQQAPVAESGGMFQRAWFQIVEAVPADAQIVARCRFWDCAGTLGGDWTVGAKIAKTADGMFYVEDVVRGQWTAHEVEKIILQTAYADGPACKQREEQEPGSSGKAVIAHRARLLAGFDYRGVPATGDKSLRWAPFAAQCEAGNVRLVRGSWNAAFIEELCLVPNGPHDDQADAAAGAFAEVLQRAPVQVIRMKGF
jgi:predicted phage terminase large subunit-like protein